MINASSCGFGHGNPLGFGHGPYGHGAWFTFPHTPGYSFVTEDEFSVTPERFETLDAHWLMLSRDRGRKLTYNFAFPSSGQVQDIQSWFQAVVGPGERFIALDHQSQTPQVVRFADPDLTVNRRFGQVFDIDPVNFRTERRFRYADVVAQDGPNTWWRLNEASGVTSVYDNGLGDPVGGVSSFNGRVVQGCSFGTPGLMPDDSNTCLSCTSATIVFSGGWLINGMRLSMIVQPLWPPRKVAMQSIFTCWGITGAVLFGMRITSEGMPQFVVSGSIVAQASFALLTDNQPHHLAVLGDTSGGVGAYRMLVDGSRHVTGTGMNPLGFHTTSGSIGSTANSAQYFDGLVQDVAFWTSSAGLELGDFQLQSNVSKGY